MGMTADEWEVVRTARTLTRKQAEESQARARRDAAVRSAVAAGLSLRRVAELADVSHQQVARLVSMDPGSPS